MIIYFTGLLFLKALSFGRGPVDLLLLHIRRSQLWWFGHLIRMLPDCLQGELQLLGDPAP